MHHEIIFSDRGIKTDTRCLSRVTNECLSSICFTIKLDKNSREMSPNAAVRNWTSDTMIRGIDCVMYLDKRGNDNAKRND